jgi:hypothetical protein
VLKGEAHQAIWDRGGEQPLGGFPKRIDVHRPVQAKQGLSSNGSITDSRFIPTLGVPRASSRNRHLFAQARLRRAPRIPETLNNREFKKAT